MDGTAINMTSEHNTLADLVASTKETKRKAEEDKETAKNGGKKTSTTKTATEIALGLKAQVAGVKAIKATENYKVLWELCKFLLIAGNNGKSDRAGETVTDIIMFGKPFEDYLKNQKNNHEAMLYNLRKHIAHKKRAEAMRKKSQ